MWDTLLGELGWLPREAKALSWVEADCALRGNHLKWQKSLYGVRKLGTDIHNFMSDKHIKESDYIRLPDLDATLPEVKAAPSGPDPAFLARIAKRVGQPIVLID